MTETTKRINEFARDFFKKRTESSASYDIPEFAQLYHLLNIWSGNEARGHFNGVADDIRTSAFHDALMKALESYDGLKDFLPFYKTIFCNKLIDELRKESIRTGALSLDYENRDDEENPQGSLGDTLADESVNIEKGTNSHAKVENFFKLTAAVCIEQKRAYKNKKCVCYPPLFFTDLLVYSVFDNDKWFGNIVDHNSNKFDEASVIEFLNTLLTGECDSVTEIKCQKCRPLSEFTEKQEDADKPCCGDVPNYHVFNSFLKQNNKGITQSAFSQHKSKFYELLEPLKEELEHD
ncbi:MAG: hypothetical protein NC401_18235 [Ruminococcus sp.]|nr:hypothetical protein [Ruminococcus sp.]